MDGVQIGYENKTPVQIALEGALHALVMQNGLHVTDVQDVNYTFNIDNNEIIKFIKKVLATLS